MLKTGNEFSSRKRKSKLYAVLQLVPVDVCDGHETGEEVISNHTDNASSPERRSVRATVQRSRQSAYCPDLSKSRRMIGDPVYTS